MSSYGLTDRLLHRLAFSGLTLQEAVADIEETLYRRQLASVAPANPIFITSLPRAGTTLVLNLLMQNETLASATYRDMPFLLCPMLWRALSRPFRVPQEQRERAHGDGMLIGPDSPEAFEEVVWRHFWKRKYRTDRIDLWTQADRDRAFEEFFCNHMRKIIVLAEGRPSSRYISKNNANIARLPLLSVLFPDGWQVIPVRAPLAHAHSLLRQHRRFLALQAQDAFGRRYMADLGHFEFGFLFRPVAFETAPLGDPLTLDHWLRYWIAAFGHVLKTRGDRTIFIGQEALRARPAAVGGALFERLGLSPDAATDAALAIAPPSAEPAEEGDSQLMAQAMDVYDAFLKLM